MTEHGPPDLDERTVPDEIVRERVAQCVHCSLSGHWPMFIPEIPAFVAALDAEQLRRWENYTEGRLNVGCCGRAREDFPVPT